MIVHSTELVTIPNQLHSIVKIGTNIPGSLLKQIWQRILDKNISPPF